MSEFDHGPSAAIAEHFERVPDPSIPGDFWFDWAPCSTVAVSTVRRACCASRRTPGPTERIAGRSLVGNAGQRVQGLLSKLGLTRSYLCMNAWAYAVHPSRAQAEQRRLDEPAELTWRNELYDRATSPQLEAVIAFGGMAQRAVELWSGRPNVTLCEIPHPSSRDEKRLLDEWRTAVDDLRAVVTPDADGDSSGPNYGAKFTETDHAAIPRRDLPFGAPAFLGDDAGVRAKPGGAQNSVVRPSPDDGHTLIWHAPKP